MTVCTCVYARACTQAHMYMFISLLLFFIYLWGGVLVFLLYYDLKIKINILIS